MATEDEPGGIEAAAPGGETVAAVARHLDRDHYAKRAAAAGHRLDGEDPAAHYVRVGAAEGLSPSKRHDGEAWRALAAELPARELPEAMRLWRSAPAAPVAALRDPAWFDPGHYARESGVEGSPAFLLIHYLGPEGWPRGFAPSEAFGTAWYLDMYPDVRDAGMNPLSHYLAYGVREGRLPAPPEALAAGIDRVRSAYGVGWRVAMSVAEAFDAEHYLRANPDVLESGLDPLGHYLDFGWREGRDPSADFSTRFYLSRHPEARVAGIDPLTFHLRDGHAQRLRRTPRAPVPNLRMEAERELLSTVSDLRARVAEAFDPDFYLETYPDIVRAGLDPLDHYLVHGWREGRDPRDDFSTRAYLAEHPGLAANGTNPFAHHVLFGAGQGGATAWFETVEIVDDALVAEMAPHVDTAFYLERNPEVAETGADPVRHYLSRGWREGADPSPGFSTTFYLSRYPDVARSRMIPLVHYVRHGRAEGREPIHYAALRARAHRPLVTAVVPNYNHARFLAQRLRSIDAQTWRNLEIVVLDDCSTDDSRAVIEALIPTLRTPVRTAFNERNSGNVFAQWRRGFEMARGEIVWICESDDFCEPDFLERTVPHFTDLSVQIAFGRIQFTREDGSAMDGLDAYREDAEPGIWSEPIVRPAAEWFSNAFGVKNVIANVGGCLMRRQALSDAHWQRACEFRICGDWYLYIQLAAGGSIAYEPGAVAYFRQHDTNTSATNFDKEHYYRENMWILRELVEAWGIPDATRRRFLEKVGHEYGHFGMEPRLGAFDEAFDTGALLSLERRRAHIQLAFLGFHPGGGEYFPITLANALAARGLTVSLLALNMSDINERMRATLNPRVAVYHALDLAASGRGAFFSSAGVSLLHSHIVNAEAFLVDLDPDLPIEVPLLVTLHGSYVGLEESPEDRIERIVGAVDRFVYTADRNLEFFERRGLPTEDFVNLPNAMPPDPRPAPFDRAALGIGPDDTVFTMVARGIKRKGWRAAVSAFRRLREHHGREDVHLLLVGEGEAEQGARSLAGDLSGVHFLGFVEEIGGLFRMSDVALLPTRFEGESYPLIVIQALQEGLPVIATDIGEIAAMLTGDAPGEVAGRLIPELRDSRAFFDALERAMLEMTDPALRAAAGAVARDLAPRFDLEAVVDRYEALYAELLETDAAPAERGARGRELQA